MPSLIPIKQHTENPAVDLALDTIERNKQALVFTSSKKSAEKSAEDIAKEIKLLSNHDISEDILHALPKPTKQCERLALCIKKGIAFHHAGLTSKQRELIEEGFRSGAIKIICSTPTLAAGVDLPAYRAIIKELKRYGGRWGSTYIPVLEYHQMAGRAGRPGKDTEGQAICIVKTDAEQDEVHERYILGEPEEIYSKLAVEPVLRMYVLSLIATGFVRSLDECIAFFMKSFWAHQYQDEHELANKIERVLALLVSYAFLEEVTEDTKNSDSKFHSSKNPKYQATLLGERVSQLYLDPLTAHHLILGLQRASSIGVTPFNALHLLCTQLELRPLLNVRVKEYEAMQALLVREEANLLCQPIDLFDTEYDAFLASIKTASFFLDWINECDEEALLEKYDIRPGEIRAKLEIADWLLYATIELCKLLHYTALHSDLHTLRVRLEYGAKEELLTLLRLHNIGRVRARKLVANGLKDLGALKRIDLTSLSQIVGKAIAADIKAQLGETVEPVKENKRKGQISLMDYTG